MKKVLFLSLFVLLLSGCVTKRVIEYKDRIVDHYITNTTHDTLYDQVVDSVYFEVLVKGDTVYKTKYKEKTRFRDKIVVKYDTCVIDSVVTEYKETVKEVEKIPKIYRFALWFSIIILIFAIIKVVKWVQIH